MEIEFLNHNFFCEKWAKDGWIIGFNGGKDWNHSKEFSLRFGKDDYWGKKLTLCVYFCTRDKYIESFTDFLLNHKHHVAKSERLFSWFPWVRFRRWSQGIDEGRCGMG